MKITILHFFALLQNFSFKLQVWLGVAWHKWKYICKIVIECLHPIFQTFWISYSFKHNQKTDSEFFSKTFLFNRKITEVLDETYNGLFFLVPWNDNTFTMKKFHHLFLPQVPTYPTSNFRSYNFFPNMFHKGNYSKDTKL